MTPEQFCYWLQGFVELMETEQPNARQWLAIEDHLSLVIKKERNFPVSQQQGS